MPNSFRILSSFIFSAACAVGLAQGQAPKRDLTKGDTLYVIPYAHLDTQWRWAYPQVIREYIPNTMLRNFALIEKYPNYVFNFTGVRRYEFMKDYYPADFARVKAYVKAGRWFPAGSSMDENDVNSPSGESIIRQVLYGNEWFKKEFGVASNEYMLPDCFGFPYALPSLLAHAGVKGFSTQKLTWGSAVGIPFNVGVWKGPDGKGVIAALNPGSYSGNVDDDQSNNAKWQKRIEDTGKLSGAFTDFHYYGTGDVGGSPEEDSVSWVEKAIQQKSGPVTVVSAKANEMFDALTPDQISKLPVYQGDLLLTWHSAGSITSEAFMKRMNRKNELLADGAERASVAAMWLGGAAYPSDRLFKAWDLVLGSQMHDMMAGTALPKGYEFIWNDEFLAQNQFAAIETDAVGAVSSAMDTKGQGTPLLVYNPLSIDRADVVTATIPYHLDKGQTVQVYGPDGAATPTQIISDVSGGTSFLFAAKAPSCGFATYDARVEAWTPGSSELSSNGSNEIQNARFKVTVNDDGDIASIWDKRNNKEVLKSPARLDFQHENPREWPAWNMDYEDQSLPPQDYVHGPAKISVIENGPVRVAIRVERQTRGSKFVQDIRLSAGDAGDRVEVDNNIDWRTQEFALKASFPLVSANPMATYDMQVGAVQRGNNDPKKFEVPQQQWFDLSQPDGQYGVGILNDSKFGSDKPSDDTVRLTLLYTPGTRGGYSDQGTQDIGRHEILYAIAPHAGDWRATPWVAKRVNQPMRAFIVPSHTGKLGKTFSLLQCSSPQVEVSALKKAENGNDVIVRLRELDGKQADDVRISVPGGISSAREVDGQENSLGTATVSKGQLVTSVSPFSLRAFALKLGSAPTRVAQIKSVPIPLDFDSDVASFTENPKDGAFNDAGESLPADQLSKATTVGGVKFTMGSVVDGAKNAMTANGQSIRVPAGTSKVYFLAASAPQKNMVVKPIVLSDPHAMLVDFPQDATWDGYLGQWDNRLWNSDLDSDYSNYDEWEGLVRGYQKPYEVAWFSNHKHHPTSGNEFYEYSYLYKFGFDVPAGVTSVVLPKNPGVKILAMSASSGGRDEAIPAMPLIEQLPTGDSLASPTITSAGDPGDFTTITIEPPLYWKKGQLHYTTDGSQPTIDSPVYDHPFNLYEPTTIMASELGDDGLMASASVYNVNSRDTVAPRVESASSAKVLGVAHVQFSELVNKITAENPASYTFSSGAKVLTATLLSDGKSVDLTLDKPLTIGKSESITVNGVSDLAATPNVMKGATTTLTERGAVFSEAQEHKTSAEFKPDNMPVKATDSWTINFFCKPDSMPEPLTLIAGFGRSIDGDIGTARYFSNFTKGINFWICDRDVLGNATLDIGQWQMLTATFDGKMIRLYKNGKKIAEEADILADDLPQVEIMPVDAWDKKRVFPGSVRDFSLWNEAISDAGIQRLWEAGNK